MATSWKKTLDRQIRAQHRRVSREQLASLRAAIVHAKHERKAAVCRAKNQCKADRLALSVKLKQKRARILARLASVSRQQRDLARKTCSRELQSAKGLASKVERARAELLAERKFRREMRRIEASNRAAHKEHKRASAVERRGESDEQVAVNIPESYHALWNRVRGSIRGTPRMSRTEAFMKYAEEHPDEVLESLDDATDRLVRQLERREREAARAARRRPEETAEVPF